jgi:hypothetical protein
VELRIWEFLLSKRGKHGIEGLKTRMGHDSYLSMLHFELEDGIKLLHADFEQKQLWVFLISHSFANE